MKTRKEGGETWARTGTAWRFRIAWAECACFQVRTRYIDNVPAKKKIFLKGTLEGMFRCYRID